MIGSCEGAATRLELRHATPSSSPRRALYAGPGLPLQPTVTDRCMRLQTPLDGRYRPSSPVPTGIRRGDEDLPDWMLCGDDEWTKALPVGKAFDFEYAWEPDSPFAGISTRRRAGRAAASPR
jgi:hypothetical protein